MLQAWFGCNSVADMKALNRFAVILCLGIVVAIGAAGCGGGDGTVKVDVSAQIGLLKSPDAGVRSDACVALATAGPGAAPALNELLALFKDSDGLVRRLAVYAVGQIGPAAKSAIPALKEMLNDSERDVITASINAIGSIDPEAQKALRPPPNVTN